MPKTNEELHRELWGWLAETGTRYKREWPGWKSCGGYDNVCGGCFACKEGMMHSKTFGSLCCHCPIDAGTVPLCGKDESLYTKWNRSKTIEDRKKYAAIIRDLPWRNK